MVMVKEVQAEYLLNGKEEQAVLEKASCPDGYKLTEVGVIPDDWDINKLGDLGDFKNGINKESSAFGHGSPLINLMDVFGVSSIVGENLHGLVDSSKLEQKMYGLNKGDVLFIRSSVKPSGVGLTAVLEEDIPNAVFSGFLLRFRDKSSLDNSFKRHCFYETGFRLRAIASSSVSANTNINQESLKKLLIAYPRSKKEQTAIAKALSDVDALITSLEKLIAKKQAIKTATMQQLLIGKKRLPGFGEGKGYKQTELGEIPEDWNASNLEDLAIIIMGQSPSGYSYNNDGYGVALINGPTEFTKKNPIKKQWTTEPTKFCENNDLLLCVRGSSTGRMNTANDKYCIGRGVAAIRAKSESDTNYLKFQVYSAIQNLLSLSTGSTFPSVDGKAIKSILIPRPILEEQIAIALTLSDMDEEIETIEKRLTKTQQIKQGMMQELLTGKTRLIQAGSEVSA